MARQKSERETKRDAEAFGALFTVVFGLAGILLLLPSLILSIVYLFILKNRCLQSPSAQRVINIGKVFSFFGKSAFAVAVLGIISFFTIPFLLGAIGVTSDKIVLPLILSPCIILVIITSLRVAVLYLGIVADKENDELFFPCDMQSYTFGDYLKMRFIKDLCSIDTVNLSEIIKITRGYGVDLYVHGIFGSRKITMTSKQKRDECIAMIQAIAGKKGLVMGEIESY